MRRNLILQEFDLAAEALPIVLAGILLNVVGRQISQYYGGPFVDMTGTAFVAFLLGPWWAAAAAATTTIVNGNFYESYFPFGIVNIAGALVWGYLARYVDLPHRAFSGGFRGSGGFIFWALVMALAGGVACGLTSTCVKLILYPEIGRPFIHGQLYETIHGRLQDTLGAPLPESATLLLVDLLRDIADKLIVVPIAMFLVMVTRIAPTFAPPSAALTTAGRLKTDVVSIFLFCIAYSAFILLAQLTRPIISIPGSERSIAWLGSMNMVVLLYAPLIVAVLAFRFLTYRPTDPQPRRLHALWRRRREIARHLFNAGGRRTATAKSALTKALGTGVSIWPLRHVIDPLFGIPIALSAIVIVLAAYLVVARIFYTLLQRVIRRVEIMARWLEVGSERTASVGLVHLMQSVFSTYVHVPEPQVSKRNAVVYALGFVNRQPRGRFEQAVFDPIGERVAMLAAISEPNSINASVLNDLKAISSVGGIGLIALATSTSRITDRGLIDWFRELRKTGTEILLFDWISFGRAIAEKSLTGSPENAMRQARARALHLINATDEKIDMQTGDRISLLVNRALPSLKAVIEGLPKQSVVFDLGAGYGRHTLTAALAGHEVFAVDRKEVACTQLREAVAFLPPNKGKVFVRRCDLRDVSFDGYGLADLVICTGVLQHAQDAVDLCVLMAHLGSLASQPGSLIYIEMLFDMAFDGEPPSGRVAVSLDNFEYLLRDVFPPESWAVQRTFGPMRQVQFYENGGRSFEPPSKKIESTAAEYLIRRLD